MTDASAMASARRLPDRVEDAFLAHRRELLGLARLLTGDAARAEEVVQEAFLAFHRRVGSVPPDKELAYLRGAIANQARAGWRRKSTRRRFAHVVAHEEVDHRTPEDDAVSAARRARVDAALAKLSDRQREATVLTYFTGLPVAEVADALGISEGSVKTHLHRARTALAPLLEDLR